MSHLLLLLTISAVGFPPLESFLLLPAARTGCVDPRTTATAHQSRATAGASVSSRSEHQTLSRARWTLKNGRCCNPFLRATTTATRPPLILSSAAAGGSGEAGDAYNGGREPSEPGEPETSYREQTQQQTGSGGGERKKKKKRPRSHVPVLEGGEAGGAGGVVGEPWVGVTSPQSAASSLPEPDHRARQKFGRIMEDVLAAEKEEELPALLTKHVDFLLSVDVTRLTNDLIRLEPTMERVKTLHNAYDFIVTFLEGMVESTLDVQKENQGLLREIIEVAKIGPSEFENKMKKLETRFTYEFVKYLDAEVERLEEAVQKSDRPGAGDEVLNVMKIVRIRVCAQVDLMMGEDVAVLTRMLSYNDRYMMRAALRAVFKDKSPQAVEAFGRLVSRTLKDVADMGTGVDPMLRCKLADMEGDVVLVAKDAKERMEEKASKGAEA